MLTKDQHFSVLSRFVKNYQLKQKISSTKELMDAIELEHIKSNAERIKNNLPPIQSIFLGKTLIYQL